MNFGKNNGFLMMFYVLLLRILILNIYYESKLKIYCKYFNQSKS